MKMYPSFNVSTLGRGRLGLLCCRHQEIAASAYCFRVRSGIFCAVSDDVRGWCHIRTAERVTPPLRYHREPARPDYSGDRRDRMLFSLFSSRPKEDDTRPPAAQLVQRAADSPTYSTERTMAGT